MSVVIAHRTIREIRLLPGYEDKTTEEIEEELIEHVDRISDIYMSGSQQHILWSDLERYALLVIQYNRVFERDVFERAAADLSACETGFDSLSQPWKNAVCAVHTHLYNILLSRSRKGYESGVAKLSDAKNDLSYVEELLQKFTRPSALDEKRFSDRVLSQIWDRLSEEDTDSIAKRMKRIPRIIEALNTKS